MHAQEVALRQCLENLKEASAMSVQALRDAATQGRQASILGAIDAAHHRLQEARAAYLRTRTQEA